MAALAGSVARRYARALFAIGVDRGNFEALGRELRDVAALWAESADLRKTLANPVFKPSQKRAILQGMMPRVAPTADVQKLVLLLLDRGRIASLPGIALAYEEMVDDKMNRVRAIVTSARPLDVAAQAEIKRTLERRTGKAVIMTTAVDPSLIGGVVAQVAGLVLDGSLKARLGTIGTRLLLN